MKASSLGSNAEVGRSPQEAQSHQTEIVVARMMASIQTVGRGSASSENYRQKDLEQSLGSWCLPGEVDAFPKVADRRRQMELAVQRQMVRH